MRSAKGTGASCRAAWIVVANDLCSRPQLKRAPKTEIIDLLQKFRLARV